MFNHFSKSPYLIITHPIGFLYIKKLNGLIEMASVSYISSSSDTYIWNFPIKFSNNNYYLYNGVHRYVPPLYVDDDVLHGVVHFKTKSSSRVEAKLSTWSNTYNESRVYLFAKGY